MPDTGFHPAVARWFEDTFQSPTPAQAQGWPAIREGRHTLIAAPTGSGKTLAAFLSVLDDLVRRGIDGTLEDSVHVVYVSPLRALSNDIEKNLQRPIEGIAAELERMGAPPVAIRTMVRTGDTPQKARAAMVKQPPHIAVTTPESLFILLTSESGRKMLKTTRAVIVDEIHALAGNKRGSHLALSLERLAALAEQPVVRIGLSATQKPIEDVARFLVGSTCVRDDGAPDCVIVDSGHARSLDLAIELPNSPLETVMSGEVWEEIYDRLTSLIEAHRTTIVFVNTRRVAERVARHLSDRLGEEHVTAHHGSLAREQRLDAEQRLKAGSLRALVATASLELGIDVGDVDLACQIGSTRSIATFLQRVGRSGHHLGGLPKGRLFPLSRDELVECAALFDSIRRGELDRLLVPFAPLDVLAQQIIAETACEAWDTSALRALVRRAWPYRDLGDRDFDEVVRMLSEGFATRRGRRGTFVHHDAVNEKIRGRRGARLAAITSGGAIPDNADYMVVLQPAAIPVGTLNEDFALESMAGDIFQLGNTSYRILRVEGGKVHVEDARGEPPTIPFWLGEAPARTDELSAAVSRLRVDITERLEHGMAVAAEYLARDVGVADAAAAQIVDHLATVHAALGVVPTQETIVVERFFDEAGGMHLILHAPFGNRINRAWGLALRKSFCRSFNFELQAAAVDDAIILSLGPTHSFPLEDVIRFLNSKTVHEVLVQALLDAPMFQTRWRWSAGRALAVLRFRGGRKVPPQLQRMQADDLLTVVFPDQVACLENIQGDRQIPDHPLVRETLRDCLHDAMDIEGLVALLASIERGDRRVVARDLTEPSPLAQQILNARPYAYLDDAPLEERRTRAVLSRRWLDPSSARDLGVLDEDAIQRVAEESWPDVRDADELHDALLQLSAVNEHEGTRAGWQAWFEELRESRRAAMLEGDGVRLWIAAERLPFWKVVRPHGTLVPPIEVPRAYAGSDVLVDDAVAEIVRGRLETIGVATPSEIAAPLGLRHDDVEAALARLEAEGMIFRGHFRPQADQTEWCERRLLARIHRYTVERLRSEIEPVSGTTFMRFLFEWQRVASGTSMQGVAGLAAVLEQLEGYECAAASWEREILPARVHGYDATWLDTLCHSGRFAWARRTRPNSKRVTPVRSTPVVLVSRARLTSWLALAPDANMDALSADATRVHECLVMQGACFFVDLVKRTGLLKTRVSDAIGELVTAGLVASDGFSGVRSLFGLRKRNGRAHGGFGYPGARAEEIDDAGRWSLLSSAQSEASKPSQSNESQVEEVAWALLRRWGVVFRTMLERESCLPPWRDLLRVYRRLEARGEIRGGRFVDRFTGEQYALPDAVTALRAVKRKGATGEVVSVSGCDPLNLVGIIVPGDRVPATRMNRILYQDGAVIAVRDGGTTHIAHGVEQSPKLPLEALLAGRQPSSTARAPERIFQ